MKSGRMSRATIFRLRESAGRRIGTCDGHEQGARGGVRRARGHNFLFTGLFVYERHPGPLLFQAHFDERGKTDAVEFISQHPVLVASVVKIAVLLFIVMTALAYLTWLERKVIAHIQSRWGPYNVGAHGLLQPLADGIKFLFKEDVTPPAADRLIYTLAPFLALALGLSAIALIPFGPPSVLFPNGQQIFSVVDLNIGLLFLFAITSMGVYGIALAGWSSNSKYALLGGLRSSAQMISYEVSLTISVVGVILLAGTLNFNEIIGGFRRLTGQTGYWLHFIPQAGTCSRNSSDFSAISPPRSRKPTASRSTCRRRKPSWSPDSTPNTPASNSPCSSWPNTRT